MQTVSINPKKFSWSWSRLKNFRTCPKRHWHIDIEKDFREEESEQLLWGNRVHAAMAKRIDKGIPLPREMAHYEDWAARVAALKKIVGVGVDVEQKLAMTKDFGPSTFFDAATWYRAVVDVKVIIPAHHVALAFDWKTGGKIQPDFEQLGLTAQVIFAHHPTIDEVAAIYVWLGHDDAYTLKVYRRDQMAPFWSDLWGTLQTLEVAWRTFTYPPKPSGLCRKYCPVTSCPYHGKGG